MTGLIDYAVKMAPKGYKTVMNHKGFKASLMQTKRLEDRGLTYGLPPGRPLPVFDVDALPGCPADWVRGPGNYVCPVSAEIGLWFDFTMNDVHNVAVLPSVKGMNPLTGLKIEGLRLEKFAKKCPKHDVEFKGDEHFCPKCEYRWPPQSYVSYPNTLWWDGFRQPDGTVRQFFFTDEEERDVASAVIGKENVVPAFGFAFFEPKTRRVVERPRMRSSGIGGQSVGGWTMPTLSYHGGQHPLAGSVYNCSVKHLASSSTTDPDFCFVSDTTDAVETEDKASILSFADSDGEIKPRSLKPRSKSVAVGAGAQIQQDLADDPLKVEEWKEEPSAVVRLYFVFQKQFKEIFKKGGILDLQGDKEGYLKGVKKG